MSQLAQAPQTLGALQAEMEAVTPPDDVRVYSFELESGEKRMGVTLRTARGEVFSFDWKMINMLRLAFDIIGIAVGHWLRYG